MTAAGASGHEWLLDIWVVYEKPRDYPHHYVVRRQTICQAGHTHLAPECYLAASLAEARRIVPRGKVHLHRMPEDEPQVVETWV